MNKRFDELDSLRGLAACAVLLGHYLLIFNQSMFTQVIQYAPTRLLVAGRESVCLFFILSGFVLALPFLNKSYQGYFRFSIKRIFRIYIPYAVSITIAISLSHLLYSGNIAELSDWFNGIWSDTFDWNLILQHYILIGQYNDAEYNPVIWSLMQEMRISLIFPLLMLIVINYTWRGSLVFYFTLLGASVLTYSYGISPETVSFTILYASMFVIGATLAKYRNELIDRFRVISNLKKITLLALGLALFLYGKPSFVINYFIGRDEFFIEASDGFFIVLGASLIIISAMTYKSFTNLLLKRPVHFLGKISYSIYLYHVIILLAFVHGLYGMNSLWIILPLSFVVTLAVSAISYKYIELPSIRWGKKLTAHSFLYLYHRWMSDRHRVEGAYQNGKFIKHRKKMHKYERM